MFEACRFYYCKISVLDKWNPWQSSRFLKKARNAAYVSRLCLPVGTALKWNSAKLAATLKQFGRRKKTTTWKYVITAHICNGSFAVSNQFNFLKHAQDWKQKPSNVLAMCCSALNCGIQNVPPDTDGRAQCVLWLRFSHKQEVIFKFYLIHLHPGVCCDSLGE